MEETALSDEPRCRTIREDANVNGAGRRPLLLPFGLPSLRVAAVFFEYRTHRVSSDGAD
jgi:hypothetical protein